MKISVFGLGYVGLVSAACFAKLGNYVIGVDINKKKILQLKNRKTYLKEKNLDDLLYNAMDNGKFTVTTSKHYAIKNSDVGFICIRSPLRNNSLDNSELENLMNELSYPIAKKGEKYVIVIRTTVIPGTSKKLEEKLKEKGLVKGKNYEIASNPEFLRESSAVKDFLNPPYIVIGADNKKTSDLVASVYRGINAPIYKVSRETAEIIKLINNSWHALEMTFINEVSRICKDFGINTKEVIKLFTSDTKLNISPYYLKPNMGYGGSCLPKDLAALVGMAKTDCGVLSSIAESNVQQIKRCYDIIKNEAKRGNKKVGIIGISFKPNSDDLRGSPMLYIIKRLIDDNFTVKIYDPLIRKEQISNIKKSYRGVIFDPLLNSLIGVKNLKNSLRILENKMFSSLEDILDCKTIVLNTKIPNSKLRKFTKYHTIINTRAIIPVNKRMKAKYKECW